MGFRDLALLNDSLLAKQTERLLHNQNSLFYRVSRQDSSLIVLQWKQKIHGLDLMLGLIF